MKRKIILVIFIFLFNILWVNAINVTNKFTSKYNLIIDTNKTNLNNNSIVENIDIILDSNLNYQGESATLIGKKINNYLTGELDNYGELIAKYSIFYEVDPYLIAGIIIENTGCDSNCNTLVKKCNNVYNAIYNKNNIGESSCFGGNYQKFNSLDDSIKSFVKFIKVNFYDNDLKTPNAIYKAYNKDVRWVFRVNEYMNKIKSSSI